MKTWEIAQIEAAAKQLDAEAKTWSDGFATPLKTGLLKWDRDSDFAQIHHMRCENAARQLRKIAAKYKPGAVEEPPAPNTEPGDDALVA